VVAGGGGTDAERTSIVRAAAVAAFLAIAVSANSLSNGLVYDDRTVVARNEAVRHPFGWRTLLLSSWEPDAQTIITYRPLTTWTFALNWAAHGDRPFGYHLVNVLAHAGVSALVVALAAAFGLSATAAGLVGALFAVHPIHTEAVANVVGRAEILAAGLTLLALLLQRRCAAAGWTLSAGASSVLACALAMLAKEEAIVLPALAPLADLVLLDRGSPRLFLRRLRGRRALFYLAVVAVAAGYLLLRTAALGRVTGARETVGFWMNPAASAATPHRVLTALEVLALAIKLLVLPVGLSADYSFRQLPVVTSAGEPGALAGILATAGLALLAAVLWRRQPVAFLWLGLSLLTYGVVSNLLIPIGTIFAERLLYLPSVGFCALLAMALARLHGGWPRVAAAVLLVGWGALTVERNPVWHDQLGFAEALAADAPDSSHAHHVLGTTYAALGRDQEALTELARAIVILPDNVGSLYNAAVIHQQRNEADEALALYRRVTDLDPRYFPAWVNSATVHESLGAYGPALDAAQRAVSLRPGAFEGYVVTGVALRGLGRLDEAQSAFEQALRLVPGQPEALLGLATTAAERRDIVLATSAFERLVQISPSRDAYRGLVSSYRQAGREDDAARAAEAAREHFPDDPSFTP
jgi:protein O-mannosyl-transferase